jgi:hypothetical protein
MNFWCLIIDVEKDAIYARVEDLSSMPCNAGLVAKVSSHCIKDK